MELKIHINSKRGIYTVTGFNQNRIWLKTNSYKFSVPANDFQCLAGGINNWRVSEKYIKNFLETVSQKDEMETIKKVVSLFYYMDFPLDIIESMVVNEGISISKFKSFALDVLCEIHREHTKDMEMGKEYLMYLTKLNDFAAYFR